MKKRDQGKWCIQIYALIDIKLISLSTSIRYGVIDPLPLPILMALSWQRISF